MVTSQVFAKRKKPIGFAAKPPAGLLASGDRLIAPEWTLSLGIRNVPAIANRSWDIKPIHGVEPRLGNV